VETPIEEKRGEARVPYQGKKFGSRAETISGRRASSSSRARRVRPGRSGTGAAREEERVAEARAGRRWRRRRGESPSFFCVCVSDLRRPPGETRLCVSASRQAVLYSTYWAVRPFMGLLCLCIWTGTTKFQPPSKCVFFIFAPPHLTALIATRSSKHNFDLFFIICIKNDIFILL
jgi:hypothetical protein